jgi:hypothetical protein
MELMKDVFNVIRDKMVKKIRKIKNKRYIVPYQEHIFISCLDSRIKYDIYKETTTDEILNVVTGWVNSKYTDLDFYVTHGSRPLRRGFTLREFGLGNGSHLQVQVRLRGGCIIDGDTIMVYSESVAIEDTLINAKRYINYLSEMSVQNSSYAYRAYTSFMNCDLDSMLQVLVNEFNIPRLKLNKEYMLGLLEDVLFLYEDSKVYPLGKALARFFKYRGFKTVDFVKIFLDHFGGIQLQAGEVYDDLWSFLKSDFFKKAFSLVSFVILKDSLKKLSISLADSSILEVLMRGIRCLLFEEDKFDPLYAIIRSVRDVFKAIKRWYDAGDINALFNEHYVDDKWFKKSTELIANSAYLTNPEAHDIDIYQYLADLDVNIEIGENNLKNFRGDARRKTALQKTILDLKRIRADELTKNAAMKSRQSPFSVLIHGSSSVGKSTFVEILFGYFGNLFGLNTDPSFRYARNGIDQYWSNFRTSHWCILFDDAAYMRPDIATNGDPSVMEIIQTINNIPFIPAQAELQDKGRTPVRCKLVLATTNSEDLNAVHYFSCPLAVQRRFPYVINIRPKLEYSRDDSREMLDPKKIPPVKEGEYPDLWKILIKKVEANPNDHSQATLVEILNFDNIYVFLKWYGKAAKEHEETQIKISHSLDVIRDTKVCKGCFSVVAQCNCAELQADIQCITQQRSLDFLVWMFSFISLIPFILSNFWKFKPSHIKSIVMAKIRTYIWILTSEKIKNTLNFVNWKKGATLLAIISTLTVVVKQLRRSKLKPQGNVNEKMESTTPDFEKTDKVNPWYNKQVELTPMDVPTASRSVAEFNSWKDIVVRQTAIFKIRNLTTQRACDGQATNICGQQWVVNAHVVEKVNYNDEIWVDILRTNATGVTNNVSCRLDPSMIRKIKNFDVAVVTIRALPPGRDLRKFVPEKPVVGIHKGCYCLRDKNGVSQKINLDKITLGNTYSDQTHPYDIMEGYISIPERDTVPGESGSVLLINTPRGPIIAGIHQAGKPGQCVAYSLAPWMFEECFSSGDLQLSKYGVEKKVGELHPKSTVRWLSEGSANIYGTFLGFRPKPKSHVGKSFIAEECLKYDYTIQHGAPEMKSWVPWNKALTQITTAKINAPEWKIQKCAEAYLQDVLKGLEGKEVKLGYLSNYEAVNGIPGVKYIDSINANSSMGFPLNESKKKHLHKDPKPDYPDGVNFSDEIWEEVAKIEDQYLQGVIAWAVFVAHLKDEPTKLAKIKAMKTRVFTGAPIDYSLVARKGLLTFVKLYQENREIFEGAPGLNCHSKEWDSLLRHMVHKLIERGYTLEEAVRLARAVAGDYSQFDKGMMATFIVWAYWIIACIHERYGCSEKHVKIIKGIGYTTAYAFVNFNGDLMQFFNSNPSGHPLTVVINGIVNSIYMRLAYGDLNPEGFKLDTFKRDVTLMTYGDDNMMVITPGCDWFNHTSIQNKLAEYGIGYTMADKEAESVPFITMLEVSFLKRTFRYDEDLGYYTAPLEHESINKMLTVQLRSKSICAEAQSVAAIHSAIREYFFYGKKTFEYRRKILNEIIDKTGLRNYMINFIEESDGTITQVEQLPLWEDLAQSFLEN